MESIQITQQFGQIGIDITQPNLNLRISAPGLEMHTTQPQLDLKITRPEVIIDLRQSFNSMGLKDTAALMSDYVDTAKTVYLRNIERTVAATTALENPKGPTVTQLADQASRPEQKQLVLGLMPDAPPRITAKLGEVQGIYRPGEVVTNLNMGTVDGDFTWGKVDVYLEREPYIDIKA